MLKITIRKNATLESRSYESDSDKYGSVEYIWGDGNYGCDCNRALFFARAGGEEDPVDIPCGETAFDVEVIDATSGTVIYTQLEQTA